MGRTLPSPTTPIARVSSPPLHKAGYLRAPMENQNFIPEIYRH
ncbi:MAG TPA: hypothetical protein VGM27_10455 [Acidobacteriaceae bacterium]